MSSEIAIKVESLSKVYKLYNSPVDRLRESLHPLRKTYHYDFYALNDVSFDIKRGESVAIIGKNGSGKSTLLKILTGVLTPTSGEVTVNGKVSALLELGAGFNPELSGIENVYFNGMLMGYTREEMEERLEGILAFADIGEFVHQPVKTYSSGMFVRLAFAVAVNVDPDILIVDEALSVGDVRFQRKCYDRINSFRDNNKTIIFVTHDVSATHRLCDVSIFIDNGMIVNIGDPRTISKQYVELLFSATDTSIIDGLKQNKLHIPHNTTPKALYLRNKLISKYNLGICEQSTFEQRHGNAKAEIVNFAIVDLNGNKINQVISGKDYIVTFNILFYEEVSDPFCAIIVRDILGTQLFYTNTELHNHIIRKQEIGDILDVQVNISNYLTQGDYFLSFVIFDKNMNEYLDRRMDALHFSVVSKEKNCGGFVDLRPTFNTYNTKKVDVDMENGPINYINKFYSQNGEDVLLASLFSGKFDGFFVEIGCIDGRRFSNTLTFEEIGWKGICVEAHSGYIDLLKKNRAGSIVYHCAVGPKDEGSVTFYANARGSLSTLDPAMEGHFRKNYSKWFSGFENQTVPMRTLNSIFEEQNVKYIEILSLDIEGYEIEALKGLSLDKYHPKVMIIECNSLQQENDLDKLVLPHNYNKLTKIEQNIFYVDNEIYSRSQKLIGKKIIANITHTLHPLDEGADIVKKIEVNV